MPGSHHEKVGGRWKFVDLLTTTTCEVDEGLLPIDFVGQAVRKEITLENERESELMVPMCLINSSK